MSRQNLSAWEAYPSAECFSDLNQTNAAGHLRAASHDLWRARLELLTVGNWYVANEAVRCASGRYLSAYQDAQQEIWRSDLDVLAVMDLAVWQRQQRQAALVDSVRHYACALTVSRALERPVGRLIRRLESGGRMRDELLYQKLQKLNPDDIDLVRDLGVPEPPWQKLVVGHALNCMGHELNQAMKTSDRRLEYLAQRAAGLVLPGIWERF